MSIKLDNWRKELRQLSADTGISGEEICDYLGVSHTYYRYWMKRVPMKRETLIGIGMALGQGLDTIDKWIVQYGDKRKLYAKDVLGDLVWIYLINANEADSMKDLDEKVNYYKLYDVCRDKIRETYISIWNEQIERSRDTADVEDGLNKVEYDPRFDGLRVFVVENIDSFKTAYSKPRIMLGKYVRAILDTHTAASGGQPTPVNFLRGYLDDAMINYIAGDEENVHVKDTKSRDVTVNQRHIPKLRKTHIAMCLALGMTVSDLNEYLELMGYSPLQPDSEEDARLINMLEQWVEKHPGVAKFKRIRIQEDVYDIISEKECLQAVSDMMIMRIDLDYEYSKNGWTFPYLKG